MSSLFGTSGIRGSAEELFTNQFCFDIGRTFSLFLDHYGQKGSIAVGMDPRESSPRIKEAVIDGCICQNREVFDEGTVPVPSLNYILKSSNVITGSIMISGSHIRAELNGVKFFAFGEEISKEHEVVIDKIYGQIKGKVKNKTGSHEMVTKETRASDDYLDYLSRFSTAPYPKWKVVVDAGNGAQSDVMPALLKRLGIEVVEHNTSIQGIFYARDTEVETDFDDLKKKVVSAKADFGIGYDSDGDRCVFIDEKGNFIPGDYTGALLALEFGKGKTVTPINTSQVVEELGLEVFRTMVGSPFVVQKMKEIKAKFGFETNGGCIFSEMLSRDGGRTTIEMLNVISRKNKRLSEIVAEMPRFFVTRDKVEYDWALKDKIIKEAKLRFKGIKTEEVDGLKIWLSKNTWILFRSSLNAPEFRVFVESKSKEESEKLLGQGMNFVRNFVKS